MQTDFPPPRIAVSVLTRMREDGLTRVLEGIAKQRLPCSDFSHLHVIVIDNDPGCSGQRVCDRLRSTYRWTLDYAVETTVGIPHARNRALEKAMIADDIVAFLDDDEVPSEEWLGQLLRVRREYSADVVFGPVSPYFPEPIPRWIERGAFFDRIVRPTGTVLCVGATNNVLMSTRMLRQSGIRFDESYRFSGGSDTFFFMRVHQAQYLMIWADEALVFEWIPRARATVKWLAMRHFRNGALMGRQESIWGRVQTAVRGIARVAVGTSCAAIFFPFGRHRSVKAIRWASYGLGLLYGVVGKHFQEYRQPRSV